MDEDLSFLLSEPTPPEPPFAAGSFARQCIDEWAAEAQKIESGELKLPGRLGPLTAAAHHRAIEDALADPIKFGLAAEAAAKADESKSVHSNELIEFVSMPPRLAQSELTPTQRAELDRRLSTFKTHTTLNK